jgi:16S rRNA (cytosine1402-N4)-methyltransferase
VNPPEIEHVPVLSGALTEQISLPQDGVMVDATVGHGGHSFLFGQQLGPRGTLVGLDYTSESLERARKRLAGLGCRVVLIKSNYSEIAEVIGRLGVGPAALLLADLGLCSGQLADADLGLSYREEMPLDMRIDESLTTTAADIVNTTDEQSLADLIYRFGQDRASRRIARFIVHRRQRERITTTKQLAEIVSSALSRPKGQRKPRKHPATRTFQALRIAVNHELDNLERLLTAAPGLLGPDGAVAIISFHSLEDGMVKRDFRQRAAAGVYRLVTKKPLVPSAAEIAVNRRARSAKLRIALKNQETDSHG